MQQQWGNYFTSVFSYVRAGSINACLWFFIHYFVYWQNPLTLSFIGLSVVTTVLRVFFMCAIIFQDLQSAGAYLPLFLFYLLALKYFSKLSTIISHALSLPTYKRLSWPGTLLSLWRQFLLRTNTHLDASVSFPNPRTGFCLDLQPCFLLSSPLLCPELPL